MNLTKPTKDELRSIADDLGFNTGVEEVDFLHRMVVSNFAAYEALDSIPDPAPSIRYARTSGRRPTAEENSLNGWYVRCEAKGNPEGPLAGRTLAMKDNICLAGVPMMNGSSTLEGYVPDLDATVVTRVLDAGGTILGKTNCEHFCLSAGSHTNPTGVTHNPYHRGFTTGGSSSGNAAVVAAGDVDMAIGGDQGGSIRVPSSYCGLYGLKPTFGLVPYTGVMPIEMSLDHVGPMTRTAVDNALLLQVIAGVDGLDPRQAPIRCPQGYVAALGNGVAGLRIGMLAEGFGVYGAEADVETSVRAAADRLSRMGAIVESVSVPIHSLGPALWLAIAAEGTTSAMMNGNVYGTGSKGLYVTSLQAAHAGWRLHTDELSDPLKILMLVGSYFGRQHHGRFYAKAQNLSRSLKAAYDEALTRYDLLLMPTSPVKAPTIPPADASREARVASAVGALGNASPFNVSGHPALSVPCGMGEGLPIGMMLVGRHFGEATLYQAAGAFEGEVDWKTA